MSGNDDSHWVGFDLGGTKMLATVFDARFKPLGRERRKTKGFEGVKAGLDRIISSIHTALDEAKLPPDQIAGIGIGCPGAVDLDRGVILEAANLGSYDNLVAAHFHARACAAAHVQRGCGGPAMGTQNAWFWAIGCI